MRVAIDPGLRATGVVVWVGGKVIGKTFRPSTRDLRRPMDERRREIVDALMTWLDHLCTVHKDKVTVIVVESFVSWVAPARRAALRSLFEFTGYLLGRLDAYAMCRNVKLREICKGTKSKEEAYMVAKAHGFEGDQHQMDAYYIGALGGFID